MQTGCGACLRKELVSELTKTNSEYKNPSIVQFSMCVLEGTFGYLISNINFQICHLLCHPHYCTKDGTPQASEDYLIFHVFFLYFVFCILYVLFCILYLLFVHSAALYATLHHNWYPHSFSIVLLFRCVSISSTYPVSWSVSH